ncbi:hypothetical protein GOP47_0028267 [Adiantum capillus-veneris]|nr:hypothetical protein GOP47_0028267 [Adiantum capillus-veneris]
MTHRPGLATPRAWEMGSKAPINLWARRHSGTVDLVVKMDARGGLDRLPMIAKMALIGQNQTPSVRVDNLCSWTHRILDNLMWIRLSRATKENAS